MSNKMQKVGFLFSIILVLPFMIVMMNFSPISVLGKTRGDLNNDNSIDMKDVLSLRLNIAGQSNGADLIAADCNGDNAIDMKDVLLLRRKVAGIPVDFAPYPDDTSSVVSSTTTTQGESTLKYTLTVNANEHISQYETQPIQGSWEFDAGETANFTVAFSVYKPGDYSLDQLKGFVSLTNCSLAKDPEIGQLVSNSATVTYTYEVNMNSDITVTGTISNPNFKSAVLSVNGESTIPSNPSRPTNTSSTKTPTTTTTKQNTTRPTVVDGYLVQLDVNTQVPKGSTYHRTDYWEVERNSTVNIRIMFPKVYKGNTSFSDWTPYVNIAANGVPISYQVSYGEVINQNCEVYFDLSLTVSADTIITGTIQHPSNLQFIARLDGDVGVGGFTGGVEDVQVCNADPMVFDQVYLSFYDANCSTYGIAWHTYEESDTPVVQYIEGAATSGSDFASAQSITATSSRYDGGYIFADYDPQNGGIFTRTEQVNNVPDYTHKVHLPQLKNNTTYSYRVGNSSTGEYSCIYTFTTKNTSANNFTFGYLSDTQWNENDTTNGIAYRNVLDSMTSIAPNPAFLMHGGDVVDVSNAIHLWGNQMATNSSNFFSKIPTFAATGNHDEGIMLQNHFAFETDKNYYSYDYQNSHFIVLDNGDSSYDVTLGTEQLNWLRLDLANAKTAGYDWIIVSFHKPLYCPKQWNQNKDTYSEIAENSGKATRRDELAPLFIDAGVDLVLQAHTHQYGRSYPMTGVNTYQTDFTTNTIDGVNYYSNVAGPIYTVFSTACNKPDPAIGTETGTYTNKSSEVFTENPYMAMACDGEDESFAVITVESNRLTIGAYHDGTQVYEKFGIVK